MNRYLGWLAICLTYETFEIVQEILDELADDLVYEHEIERPTSYQITFHFSLNILSLYLRSSIGISELRITKKSLRVTACELKSSHCQALQIELWVWPQCWELQEQKERSASDEWSETRFASSLDAIFWLICSEWSEF